MHRQTYSIYSIVMIAVLSLGLTACGGTKVLKDPEPMVLAQPLGSNADSSLETTLGWVIVRDGPGTWAKNADWDEYLVTAKNLSEQPVRITGMTVIDSLDTPITTRTDRKQLVKGTKQTAKRYKGSGIEVKAGRGTGSMVAVGVGATVVGVGVGTAVGLGAAMGGSAAGMGSAGAVAGGLLLIGPALAVGGVVRGLNNSAVNKEIEQRRTKLPLTIEPGTEQKLDLFFPVSPSPKRVELIYTDASGEHRLLIDTSGVLSGLHLGN